MDQSVAPEVDIIKALSADPVERYAAFDDLRAQCPVHKMPNGKTYMALGYDAVATGLRSVSSFGGSAAQDGLAEEDTTIAGILEPRHLQIRRIINQVVSVHRSQQIEAYLETFIGGLAKELTAGILERGAPVEVMEHFVQPIPPAAMARLMGFPEADSAQYYGWGSQLGVNIGRAAAAGESLSLRDACPEMASYVEGRIVERQALPDEQWPNDALTRFLRTDVEGERLSVRSIVIQIMFAIGAGSDTTRNTLGSLLWRLAQAPDTYARICADRTLVEPAIEEALRVDSPAQFMVRRCLAPSFDLEGTALHEGESVFLSIGSANRDPQKYQDPMSYDLDRERLRDHLAFGNGPHTCPGATLARTEMQIALNVWCDTFESFSLPADFRWTDPGTGMLHGPDQLPLHLVPR
jgi:cytochrome P450 PksS